jgi:hypothetical protein
MKNLVVVLLNKWIGGKFMRRLDIATKKDLERVNQKDALNDRNNGRDPILDDAIWCAFGEPNKTPSIESTKKEKSDEEKFQLITPIIKTMIDQITLADMDIRAIDGEIGNDETTVNCPKGCALQNYTARFVKALRNNAQELNNIITRK